MADQLQLSKFFSNSEVREFRRSEVHPADYNPRTLDDLGRKNLKRSIKTFGIVGGIVINVRTGNTVVGGHQKIALLDEFHKYDPVTNENDYLIRGEAIDVDEQTEKTLNIALNNPNVGGTWDYDKMREIVPDIDYKAAGLSDADLNMIGVDFLLQTEGENDISNELEGLMSEADSAHERTKAERKELRDAERAAAKAADTDNDDDDVIMEVPSEGAERQAKIDHMKDVKQQVKEQAMENARNMDAFVMISFSDWKAKAQFCQRFGYDPYVKFIKGEVFDEQVERVE